MAITNYSSLQTSVLNWLSRTGDTNLTALIPDCIALAEANFNRLLRVREMETITTLTPTSAVCALPSDYLELKRLYINTSNPVSLEYLPPEQFYVKYPILTNDGIDPSKYYTIQGDNIYLADSSGNDISILYYASIPDLATNDTNWLLTRHPDLYLSMVLGIAYGIIKKPSEEQSWLGKTNLIIDQIKTDSFNGRASGSAMRVIAS